MSGWLQHQALAPAVLRLQGHARRRRRRTGDDAAGSRHDASAPARVPAIKEVPHGAPWVRIAEELGALSSQMATLRRQLRRVGVLVLVCGLLLALPYGWPALRWLLLMP
jgi:hypothetical protein